MEVRGTTLELWPTRVGFFETDPAWDIHARLAALAIARTGAPDLGNAAKRRVRGILDDSEDGLTLKQHLFGCARAFLGDWASYLAPDHCENRALVMHPGSFISTHKDSREGHLACVYFLTGGGIDLPINTVGDPRFVLEDPSRYFDEARLPFDARHGYSVNPRPGLAVFFPSHIPHNQHPYCGTTPHVQIVANFRVDLPSALEERMFD